MQHAPHGMIRGFVTVAILAGAGCRGVSAPEAQRCAQPAPVLGTYNAAAPSYIVQYRDGIDPIAETTRLARTYGFTPTYVYSAALHGFAASLTPGIVASLQCEASVARIEHDAVGHTA